MVLPATFFALTSHLGERMHPYLTLGSSLLDPFAGAMAAWSDLLNIVLTSVANGIVYAVIAGGLGALVTTLRRR